MPLRFTYDNNYFNDRYQGIPEEGYTRIAEKLLEGVEVRLSTDFLAFRREHPGIAEKIVYTGAIDEYFECCFGPLQYRSLRFETERLEEENFQGNAVVNYTAREVPYTRVIEHKHFTHAVSPVTYVTREYPDPWSQGKERYYPVNDAENEALYRKYKQKAEGEGNVLFCGRLGSYRYLDMDKTVKAALDLASTI